jgi:hypothetical protein
MRPDETSDPAPPGEPKGEWMMAIDVQKSSHGAGKYSIQVFDAETRALLADANVNQSQWETGVTTERLADGVDAILTYSPVKVLVLLRDGKPYVGPVTQRERPAAEHPWYLLPLERELGIAV